MDSLSVMTEIFSRHDDMASPVKPRGTPSKVKKADLAVEVSRIVGENLRAARRRQNHSLDTLARASGVSRAMLGQIETGKSVPTITLIWRVAEALGIPVTQIIAQKNEPSAVLERAAAARVTLSSGGRYTIRTIANPNCQSDVQFLHARIAPGHKERVAASRQAAKINLFVSSGTVELTVGSDPPLRLGGGDAVFFPATFEHVLANPGDEESNLFLVVTPIRVGQS